MELERTFEVLNKGHKGKGKKPYVLFTNGDGEKLEIRLTATPELDRFEIEDHFVFKLAPIKQAKLS